MNLASKQSRTILAADKNYSYADGDQYYQWSPDSKWLLVQFGPPERIFTPEVGLISADGKGELHNLTQSGYDDFVPKWAMDGKMMIWGSDREGTLNQGGGAASGDVYAMYFTKAFFDRSRLSKEEFALLKEAEEKQEKEKKEAEEKAKSGGPNASPETPAAADKGKEKKLIDIDWDNLTDRKSQAYAAHFTRVRLGTFQRWREAFLSDELRKRQRPVGHGAANERNKALQ